MTEHVKARPMVGMPEGLTSQEQMDWGSAQLEQESQDVRDAEARARRANAADLWDRLWSKAESRDWRAHALGEVYKRIITYIPEDVLVVDFGGGVGFLGAQLREARNYTPDVLVLDHSQAALAQAREKGLRALYCDLEDHNSILDAILDATDDGEADPVWVSTETLEHLSAVARSRLLSHIGGYHEDVNALFTVPNNRLGPPGSPGPGPKEAQHTIQFTAITFREELREHFDHVRVEVHGPYLLGVCGPAAKVTTKVSMCLPVRDEEADLEAVLASFRGFVDEIVVGVDPRTNDRTREIAAAYADLVFELRDPACQDPENPLHDPAVPPEGCHFSWVRNQCIERCTSPWVFMTEGHERLWRGQDILLGLAEIIPGADVAYVWRKGIGQRWLFPWLTKQSYRYRRSTHNVVSMPEGTKAARLLDVVTFHDRDHGNAEKRSVQRRLQNRKTLWEDWDLRGDPSSLFYFAQELREDDPLQAIERFEQFLEEVEEEAGQMRYQARLIVAKLYLQLAQEENAWGLVIDEKVKASNFAACRRTLHGCTQDDWSRTEHWLWLGDLAFGEGDLLQAYQLYSFCGVNSGRFPPAVWWIDEATYLWLPAQRLAMTAGHLGREHEALIWAKRVLVMLPPDAPEGAFEETQRNIKAIEEVIEAQAASDPAN